MPPGLPDTRAMPLNTPMATTGPAFVELNWGGQPICIEHLWVGTNAPSAPLMVFLHEGLGSVSMWRDFPALLCQTLGCRGLVYSRPGYGQSQMHAADQAWSPDYMHRQALEVLPAFLNALGVTQPVWLLGHSDGGSIALIYASRHSDLDGQQSPSARASQGQAPVPAGAQPSGRAAVRSAPPVAGVIVLAPHIRVEDISVQSIAQARVAYESTDLRARLGRHHADPDVVFWRWNRIWLDPAFRRWSLEDEISSITCPLLAVQGLDDEYGTLEQIRGIRRRVPQTVLMELADCGHSAHRDQAEALTQRIHAFFKQHCPSTQEEKP